MVFLFFVGYGALVSVEAINYSDELSIFIIIVYFTVFLFVYALICLVGSATQKLFWAGIAVVLHLVGMMAGGVFLAVTEPGSAMNHETSMWLAMQVTIVSVITQGLATFILVRRQIKTTKMSPVSVVLLAAIPVISCFTMGALANFGGVYYDNPDIASLELSISVGIAVINFAAFALYGYVSKMNARMMVQQKELQKAELERFYHAEIKSLYEETRAWRHDFRHHIQTIKSFFVREKYSELGGYLEKIEKSASRIEPRINSGNEVLDVVVNTKIARAEEEGIRFKAEVQMNASTAFDSLDLTTLVGNLLDNAIEASAKTLATDKDSYIDFSMNDSKTNQLLISVNNSMLGQPIEKDGRFLSTKTEGDHGIGLQQIDSVVEKYDGFVMREAKDGVFSTLIRIPLSEA